MFLKCDSRSIKPTSNFAKVRFQLYNAPLWLTRHMNFGMIECKSLKVVAKVGEHCNGDSQGSGANTATVTRDWGYLLNTSPSR